MVLLICTYSGNGQLHQYVNIFINLIYPHDIGIDISFALLLSLLKEIRSKSNILLKATICIFRDGEM